MIKFKPYLMQCKCGTGHNRASVLTRNRFYFYFLKMKFSCRRSQLLLSNGFVAFREVVEHKKKEHMTIIPTSKLWPANKNFQQRNATRNHCKSEFAENTDDKENVAFEIFSRSQEQAISSKLVGSINENPEACAINLRAEQSLQTLCHVLETIIFKDDSWFCSFISCGGLNEIGHVISIFVCSAGRMSEEECLALSTALGLLDSVLQLRPVPDTALAQPILPRSVASGLLTRALVLPCLKITASFCTSGPIGHRQVLSALLEDDPAFSSDEGEISANCAAAALGERPHRLLRSVAAAVRDAQDPDAQRAALALLLAAALHIF